MNVVPWKTLLGNVLVDPDGKCTGAPLPGVKTHWFGKLAYKFHCDGYWSRISSSLRFAKVNEAFVPYSFTSGIGVGWVLGGSGNGVGSVENSGFMVVCARIMPVGMTSMANAIKR